jgi:hypothetical protein
MDRNIAIITHELTLSEQNRLQKGLEDYTRYALDNGIDIGFQITGNLGEIVAQTDMHPGFVAKPQKDGTFSYQDLDRCLSNLKFDSQEVLTEFSDILLVVNRPIFDPTPNQWHTISRNGEVYGGGCYSLKPETPDGSYAFLTLKPLQNLDSQKVKYLQYVLRHELGHNLGGFCDLSKYSEDNVMKPLVKATRYFLRRKNIDYTPQQIETIQNNLRIENLETIKAFRARRNKG